MAYRKAGVFHGLLAILIGLGFYFSYGYKTLVIKFLWEEVVQRGRGRGRETY